MRGGIRVPLAVAGTRATGALTVAVPAAGDRRLTYQVLYVDATGRRVHLAPVVQPVTEAAPNIAARAVPGLKGAKPGDDAGPAAAFGGRRVKLEPFVAIAVATKAGAVLATMPGGFLKH